MNWVASKACHADDVSTDTWTELGPMLNGTGRGTAVVEVHGRMIHLAGRMVVHQTVYQDAVNPIIAVNTTSSE